MQTSNQNTWQKIWQADKDHFIHPWTEFESFKKEGSIIFQSAKGSYIFDSNGKKYLDGIGGLWCINILSKWKGWHFSRSPYYRASCFFSKQTR